MQRRGDWLWTRRICQFFSCQKKKLVFFLLVTHPIDKQNCNLKGKEKKLPPHYGNPSSKNFLADDQPSRNRKKIKLLLWGAHSATVRPPVNSRRRSRLSRLSQLSSHLQVCCSFITKPTWLSFSPKIRFLILIIGLLESDINPVAKRKKIKWTFYIRWWLSCQQFFCLQAPSAAGFIKRMTQLLLKVSSIFFATRKIFDLALQKPARL